MPRRGYDEFSVRVLHRRVFFTRTGAHFARNALMADLIRIFGERGDLAHLALFLWAASATALRSSCCANSPPRCAASTISCASCRASTKVWRPMMDTLHSVMRSIRRRQTKTAPRSSHGVSRIPLSSRPRVEPNAARDVKAVRKAEGHGRPKGIGVLPPPLERGGSATQRALRAGVGCKSADPTSAPHPTRSLRFGADPPPPGEGEGALMLAPITIDTPFPPRTTIPPTAPSRAMPACSARSTRRATW